MIYEKTVAVVGGDSRQAHLANMLIEKNNDYKVYGMFLENGVRLSSRIHKSNDIKLVLPQCDIIIFPLPLFDSRGFINTPQSQERITIEDCLEYMPPEVAVFAGMVPSETCCLAKDHGIELTDYNKREEFAVLNAVPTAFNKL